MSARGKDKPDLRDDEYQLGGKLRWAPFEPQSPEDIRYLQAHQLRSPKGLVWVRLELRREPRGSEPWWWPIPD